MRRPRSRQLLVAAALVLPVVAGACSSNGSTTNGTSSSGRSSVQSAPSSSASAPTGTPIKIGFAVAQTGVLQATFAPAVPVAQAWAKWVNSNGGIKGHRVAIDVADTQSTPTAGQAAVKQLVQQDGVSALMIADNTTEGAVASYLVSQNIAVVGENGFDPSVWGVKPNFFTTVTVPPYTTTAEVVAAKAVGADKVGAMACAEIPACATVGQVLEPTTKSLGLSYTGLVTTSASAANYTAQCVSLMQKGSKDLILAVPPQEVVRIAENCIQQNFTGYFGESSVAFDPVSLGKVNGVKVAGDLSAFPWWASAQPVQEFRNAMTKYAPSADYQTDSATGVWTALELFRKAVSAQATGDITRASVLSDYYQVKDETLGGLLPQPVTFTKGKPAPVVKATWLFTFTGGDTNPKIIHPTGTSCNGASGDLASTCQ
jgi:branched-chain amino acid transport system substrate-binding protein